MTRWPNSWLVAPQPSRSASSLPSPPAGSAWTRVTSLRPVRASPLAQVDQRIGGLLDAEPLGQGGRQQQAGVGHGMGWGQSSCRAGPGVAGSQQHSMTATLHPGYDPRR
jgi:hypothetical protein